VNLGLGIACLWIGAALLSVAFHPLAVESGTGGPADIMHAMQAKVASQNSAYDSLPTPTS